VGFKMTRVDFVEARTLLSEAFVSQRPKEGRGHPLASQRIVARLRNVVVDESVKSTIRRVKVIVLVFEETKYCQAERAIHVFASQLCSKDGRTARKANV